jgi:phosphoribosylformimino-5-aminoimidazole carboxamide ribonucleotide (ProFAR) isomerase
LLGRALEVAASAANYGPVAVIASGGVRSIADLEAVRLLGCRGAIVGRALYEGQIILEDALSFAADASVEDDATDPRSGVLNEMTMNGPTP